MFDIKEKIVVITGAATGIGASVVRALLEEGVKHATILDTDEINGVAVQEELNTKHGSNNVKFIKCDITSEYEILNAFKIVISEQGYIDVVINNAGICNDKNYTKEIEVNLTALVRCTLEAWNLMRRDEGGRGGTIINVASIAAFTSFPPFPIYSATKSAVLKFSTTLGDEVHYTRTGVRILTVSYGLTDTQMITKEKISSFDSLIENSMHTTMAAVNLQMPEQAAQGLVEAYKKGKSASVWIVTSGKPAVDVTEKWVQSCELFDSIIFD